MRYYRPTNSDHAQVVAKFQAPKHRRAGGKTVFSFNKARLRDPVFVAQLKAELRQFLQLRRIVQLPAVEQWVG